MVDYFALALSHSLLLFAVWHLLWRGDLDQDPARDGGESQPSQEVPNKQALNKQGGVRSPAPRPPGLRPRA